MANKEGAPEINRHTRIEGQDDQMHARDARQIFLRATSLSQRQLAVPKLDGDQEAKTELSNKSMEKEYRQRCYLSRMRSSQSLLQPSSTDLSKKRDKLFDLMKSYLSKEPEHVAQFIVNHIEYTLARFRSNFDDIAAYLATAYSVRDHLIEGWNDTQQYYMANASKFCCYLSIEYLLGRSLQNAISNMCLEDPYHSALKLLGYELEDIYDYEPDAALGNGGLGRLAACFLDSLATAGIPAWGYGLRYQYGMFKQAIKDNCQVEMPDYWLGVGNPWEIPRLGKYYHVWFYGYTTEKNCSDGIKRLQWVPGQVVHAQAYDIPIPGYRTLNVTNLRLWESKPATEFNLKFFHAGLYEEALKERQEAERITHVLYPDDSTYRGRVLRLKQQYFLCSATLQDIISRYKLATHDNKLVNFGSKVVLQLNDTHPTISIPELMRLLMDDAYFSWEDAWNTVINVFCYTNHTVMPEALETWEISIIEQLLPRHMQIIYYINYLFLEQVAKRWPGDVNRLSRMSILEESPVRKVRMAYLAIVASRCINGVSQIHSDILRRQVFPDFVEMWPDKFLSITNGVTPRRWLSQANPSLAALISSALGDDNWIGHFERISELRKFANDEDFQKRWNDIRIRNKKVLCQYVSDVYQIHISPNALFDNQIKRIHEYKRQLMNIFGIIYRYIWLKSLPLEERRAQVDRVFFIGGKAAPGYRRAKLIIKLINQVANVINQDTDIGPLLKVVFLSNYNVSLAELIVGATDVSQHISTAGTEASGTSNMKFAMNGSLLLGTWDGATIEIAEEVGMDNVFIFGAREQDVPFLRNTFNIDERLWAVINKIMNNDFGCANEFAELIDPIRNYNDYYLVAHDYPSYLDAQSKIDDIWRNRPDWIQRSILTTAGTGKFSSDHAVMEYATKIWNIAPCKMPLAKDIDINYPGAKQLMD